jgi:hypothetical protein
MWKNKETGEKFDTTRELVKHIHKDENTAEVTLYCHGCKESTDQLYIKKWGQHQCLECGTSIF